MPSDTSTVLINMFTVIPPTIAALAAFRATQSVKVQVKDVKDQVGETDGSGTIAAATADTQSSILLATKILDRMDERLETVEKGQKAHELWHAEGQRERRKSSQ